MAHKMIMVMKSGREFHFECDEYKISTFNFDGTISNFEYKGGVGECPIYFMVGDIESIAEVGERKE